MGVQSAIPHTLREHVDTVLLKYICLACYSHFLVLHCKEIACVKEERLLKDLAASRGLQFAEKDFGGFVKVKPHPTFTFRVWWEGPTGVRADQCDDLPGFPVANEKLCIISVL